ncbi:hypothetical protein ACFQH6_07875 [Halobacteriaceae archaeon GCM10025711]
MGRSHRRRGAHGPGQSGGRRDGPVRAGTRRSRQRGGGVRRRVRTGTYPEYQVYRQEVDGRLFLLTELQDPDAETAIVVASNFELLYAGGLVEAAEAEGAMYTHVQTLDKTYLGSFRHDDWEKFFPDAERIREGIR